MSFHHGLFHEKKNSFSDTTTTLVVVIALVNDYIVIDHQNGDAGRVKMAEFLIPGNPANSIHQIPDRIRILKSTVFTNPGSNLVSGLTSVTPDRY